jgi:hypothetical protein
MARLGESQNGWEVTGQIRMRKRLRPKPDAEHLGDEPAARGFVGDYRTKPGR